MILTFDDDGIVRLVDETVSRKGKRQQKGNRKER
jgi:hypothetical protein